MTSTRRIASLITLALLVLPLAGCSSTSGGTTGTVTATITEKDGAITVSSDLVKAGVGQRIAFKITTDTPDEIHVHSVPDHEFDVMPGPEKTFTFSVSTPGAVEVESDGLDETILKLVIG